MLSGFGRPGATEVQRPRPRLMMNNDKAYDLVVVGSGAGALLGAIRAADEGLSVLVVEKTPLVGGTSAISGGAILIPDNHRCGLPLCEDLRALPGQR